MTNKVKYEDSFLKSLNILTGIPISKIRRYAKENNVFNILEHPMVVDPNEKQLKKLDKLNEFLSSYSVLRLNEEKDKITLDSSKKAGGFFISLLRGIKDKEKFLVAFLDNGNNIIELKIVSEGSISEAVVYPRDILKMVLANDCKGMIFSHNHPGSSLKPSAQDIALTQRLIDIFKPLEVEVLDHIIVAGDKCISMKEEGFLPKISMGKANYEPIMLDNEDANEDSDELEL